MSVLFNDLNRRIAKYSLENDNNEIVPTMYVLVIKLYPILRARYVQNYSKESLKRPGELTPLW